MNTHSKRLASIVALMGALLLACGSVPTVGELLASPTPTVVPTPTPQGDYLTYLIPAYRIGLQEGEPVPGSQLLFVQQTESTYEVEIDGQRAIKRAGDSFVWKGIVAPGVVGRYNLRLTSTFFGELFAAGPVELTVLDPLPVELPATETPTAPLYFNEVLLNYSVPVGGNVPGTTLIYRGRGDQGAELAGTNNYPYFQTGDSLVWTGQVRNNVVVRYSLRILNISDSSLQLTGLGEIWIR